MVAKKAIWLLQRKARLLIHSTYTFFNRNERKIKQSRLVAALTYPTQSLWQEAYTSVRNVSFWNLTVVSMTLMSIELCLFLLHCGIVILFYTLVAFRWIEILYKFSSFTSWRWMRRRKGKSSVIEVFYNLQANI